ncbi:MAG: sodium/glutamate symporter [Woeseiaceae bacterium]|nr:sodium/glutamate symporter [Woeseiaceae bacterium]
MELSARQTVIVAILVLALGKYLTKRSDFLKDYNIPEPVSGGLIASVLFGLLYMLFDTEVRFALDLRNTLLVVFFTTIGLSSKLDTLKQGGKPLVIMLVLAVGYLFLQNITGIGVAALMGQPLEVGLIAGSVSLSGGHGTAIAWAPRFAQDYGIGNAMEIGIASATFGLIMGGVIGGPIAQQLIKRDRLTPSDDPQLTVGTPHEIDATPVNYENMLRTIFILAVSIGLGESLNSLLEASGINLPTFVSCLFAGIIVTNVGPKWFPRAHWPERSLSLALISELSLGLFLAMSLMSLQLWTLADLGASLFLILVAQVVVACLFVVFVIYRAMGRDYDAAVMSAGYAGLALGATPTAIANMTAVTERFGASPKAFMVVPLVGAFFIDVSNAVIIQFVLDKL